MFYRALGAGSRLQKGPNSDGSDDTTLEN